MPAYSRICTRGPALLLIRALLSLPVMSLYPELRRLIYPGRINNGLMILAVLLLYLVCECSECSRHSQRQSPAYSPSGCRVRQAREAWCAQGAGGV
ncbi:hypothetical protein BDV35DRAFT_365047 [Aspergillus flavus]|uniref:Uncharacterized protein n=1 Tax=Aspergillus flavus TaxID=5059 RepID=A0A5N6GLD8_ASPFL|nr:hypothetical protein BDV35DRAFT_365047 [Aspergillus flavus]